MSKKAKNNSNFIEKVKFQAADTLKLPKEILFGECIITILGKKEIYIENYKGILECTSTYIRVSAKDFRLCIEGSELSVSYYDDDEMKIIGNIKILSLME